MNPYTDEFEPLERDTVDDLKRAAFEKDAKSALADKVAALGGIVDPAKPFEPVWEVGERVVIKGYTFEVTDIGKDRVIFKPAGPHLIGG